MCSAEEGSVTTVSGEFPGQCRSTALPREPGECTLKLSYKWVLPLHCLGRLIRERLKRSWQLTHPSKHRASLEGVRMSKASRTIRLAVPDDEELSKWDLCNPLANHFRNVPLLPG